MSGNQYKFKIKTSLFEIEVEGDRGFVEKMVSRYEAQYLGKLKSLIEPPPVEKNISSGQSVGKAGSYAKPAKPASSTEEQRPMEMTSKRQPHPRQRKPGKFAGKQSSPLHSEEASKDAAVEDRPSTDTKKRLNFGDKLPQLIAFYKAKDPKTHQEKVLLFGYFLDRDLSVGTFNAGDIEECYRAVSAEPPRNTNQTLSHATRVGFVSRDVKGRKVLNSLTSRARQFVESNFKSNDDE